MRKLAGALALAFTLAACMGPQVIDNLEPSRVETSAADAKLAGKYAVAIVGNFAEPLVLQGKWHHYTGGTTPGSSTTIHVGEPLRKTLTAALTDALAEPVFVRSEQEARTLARQGLNAIIVRYAGASGSSDLRPSNFGMTRGMSAHMSLDGQLILLRPGAPESSQSIASFGGERTDTVSLTWEGYTVPAWKTAAERAITNFAAKAVVDAKEYFTK
jgi:hypothetical protein